jgi:predicted nucleotidyltransferase
MNCGLSEATIARIQGVLAHFAEVDKAVLYGSRAKGNYRAGSDIDLTLYGPALSFDQLGAIANELDDLLLPYTIDLSIFEQLSHPELREHIERVGKVFYQRQI